jgi:hypothetical protein
MTEQRTVSLKELWAHVRTLDNLISAAWFDSGVPAEIDFSAVREHARGILALVGEDEPAAQDNERKSDRLKRAEYQRAARDEALAFDLPAILGLSHVRKGSQS